MFVVVLTNNAFRTRTCRSAWTRCGNTPGPPIAPEVIVVDNGSTEDPTAVARAHYPGVRVVRTGKNLGFSGGNNAGTPVAAGDWLVFLNDDAKVEAVPAERDDGRGGSPQRRIGWVNSSWTGPARVLTSPAGW